MLPQMNLRVLALLCILSAVVAFPVPNVHDVSIDAPQGVFNMNAPRSISTLQSTSHRGPSQPACNDIPSHLLQKPHSFFINAKAASCTPRIGSVHSIEKTLNKSPSVYAMLRSLSSAERVLAPVIILFAMVWIAALAVGTVEGVSRAWKRWYYMEEQPVVDDDILEEVVISLGHVEDDWEDQELMCLDTTMEKSTVTRDP